MYNVLISGALGKMGNELYKRIQACNDLRVICGFDKEESFSLAFPVYSDISKIKEIPDIIIDFSHVNLTMEIIKFAKGKNIPIVIATTGFSEDQEKEIIEYSKTIPVFKSANMSFDINLMCKLVSKLAPMLSDADIEIIETHHRNKIDSPSGTALMLANSINESLDNKMNYVYNRHE